MNSATWALVAAIVGLAGGGVLAFSLNRVLWELGFDVEAVNTSIASMASGGDVYVFQGLDARLKKANKVSARLVTLGLLLLVLSFSCSAVSLWQGGREQASACRTC